MIEKISISICKNSQVSKDDLEKVQYALASIINDVSKFLILIVFFSIINRENYFLHSLIILLSIRIFSGGIHFQSYNKCLCFTFCIFLITSIIAPILPSLGLEINYVIISFSIAVIAWKAPSQSVNRPIRSEKRRCRLKILAIFFTLTWSYILFFHIRSTALFNCGMSSIFLQALQLLVGSKSSKVLAK